MNPEAKHSDNKLVKDYMVKRTTHFGADDDILTAVERMQKHNVPAGPVTDENGTVIGFLSEQDCLAALLQASYHCESTATVRDLMRTDVLTVAADESIFNLARRLSENKPKIYPVVDQDKLIGLISRKEVVAALLQEARDCHLLRSA